MTTDMHVRIGSVTKTVTGTALLQLAEEGKLSLDDTIGKYVSGCTFKVLRLTGRRMAVAGKRALLAMP